MLVVMKAEATPQQVEGVCAAIREQGLDPHPIPGPSRIAIGITGNKAIDPERLASLSGVVELIRVTQPFKLVSREMQPDDTIVDCGGVKVGGKELVVVGGPCSVETREQLVGTAKIVAAAGGSMLRGGAFKPRTSPYSFQGMGEDGLKILAEAREQTGLPIVTEACDIENVDLVEKYADVIQIGSRNMQNYALLRRCGKAKKPVLLKRWMSGTLNEFLLAAEYIVSEGNPNVILCERGIRAFSDYTRFTLDISIVPELKRLTHLPVVVDPSHAAGRRELVLPLALAGIAAGADGLLVETHPEPEKALSDGRQSLTPESFAEMMGQIERLAPAIGRELHGAKC